MTVLGRAVLAATLVTLSLVAGCSTDAPDPPPPSQDVVTDSPSPTESPSPTGSPSPTADETGDYLGCGEYCLQAGEYGDPGDDLDNPAELADDVITLADGMLPLTVECYTDDRCRGAILILQDSEDAEVVELGRSDLDVAGDSTRTIAVKVSDEGLDLLDQEGDVEAFVALDLGDPDCPDRDEFHCVVAQDITAHAD
jgi:hypothetical protein